MYSKHARDWMCEEQNYFDWQGERMIRGCGDHNVSASPLALLVEAVLFFIHLVRGIFGVLVFMRGITDPKVFISYDLEERKETRSKKSEL